MRALFLSAILTLSNYNGDPVTKGRRSSPNTSTELDIDGCLVYEPISTSKIIEVSTCFRQDLIEKAARKLPNNFIISPLAATLALCAVMCGDQWQPELRSRMGIRSSLVDHEMQSFLHDLEDYNQSGLTLANSVFVSPTYKPSGTCENYFTTEFRLQEQEFDFQNSTKIKHFMKKWFMNQGTSVKLKAKTSLAGLTAITFDAQWANKFNVTMTKLINYDNANGVKKPVAFMNVTGRFHQGSLPKFNTTFIELPYKSASNGLNVSMFLIESKNNDSVGFMSYLRNITIKSLIAHRNYSAISISFPKIKIESEIDVKALLHAKGGVAKSWAPFLLENERDKKGSIDGSKLPIDQFVQRASIIIHENGTQIATYDGLPLPSKSSDPFAFGGRHLYFMIGTTGENPLNLFTARFGG